MSFSLRSWAPNTPAHRWVIVVPVVVLLIVLTIREGVVREFNPFTMSAASTPDHLVADDGSSLVYDGGFATVEAGDWEVVLWNSAAYISSQKNGLTVAAFDAPVVVRGPKGVAVVPPMHQWRAPSTFVPDASADPVAWMDALSVHPLPEHFARAHEQEIAAWRAEDDDAIAPTFNASLLASATSAELAAYAKQEQNRALAAAIRSHADMRLSGLVSPSFRHAAWGFAPALDGLPDDDTWIALLLLPRLERFDAVSSPLTVRRWGQALAGAFAASPDADELRSALLPTLEEEITRMAADGYPVRALRFAEALRGAMGTGALATDAAVDAYARLSAMTPETLRASVLSEVSAPVAPTVTLEDAPAIIVADPALEQRARERLVARNAMFTKESSVETAGEGIVDVTDVVFALPSGDRALRFRYSPEADTAQAIIDGAIQPYTVPFDAYLEWEATR